jgi:glycosyltransferase involved in cell wall biosynthesis
MQISHCAPDLGLHGIQFSSIDTLAGAVIDRKAGSGVQDPLLSVIVPVYNVEKYVGETIGSILSNARHADLEIIIVNDGSTDCSLQRAVAELKNSGVRFIAIDTENGGLSVARNRGIACATGRYIAFLDSDDFVAPTVYADMIALAEARGCDQVFSRSIVFDEQSGITYPFYDATHWHDILQGRRYRVFHPLKTPRVFLSEPNMNTRIWRRSFWTAQKFTFPVGRLFEDVGVHTLSLVASRRIGIIDAIGYHYRVGRLGKITVDKSSRRIEAITTASELTSNPAIYCLPAYISALIIASFNRILFWCRGEIAFSLRHDFDRRLGTFYRALPRAWLTALYKTDARAALKILQIRSIGGSLRSMCADVLLLSRLVSRRKRQ